jgi:hypothetical protein
VPTIESKKVESPIISQLQISQLSSILPFGLLKTLFPDILLKVMYELEEPENWREIFENYPTRFMSASNLETSVNGNGCIVNTVDAEYKIAEEEKFSINGTVYTVENTGGGADYGVTAAQGFSPQGSVIGGSSGPSRLYVVVEYKIGQKFFYQFIVKAKEIITICSSQAPQHAIQIVSGEWILANHEEEALISTRTMSGGLEDRSHAGAMRDALVSQHPGSTTSNSTLSLHDS